MEIRTENQANITIVNALNNLDTLLEQFRYAGDAQRPALVEGIKVYADELSAATYYIEASRSQVVRLIKIKAGQYSYKGCSIVRGEVSANGGRGWYYLNPSTLKTAYVSTLQDAVLALDYASKVGA